MKAKDVLYPNKGSLEETAEHAAMYIKTHANYAAGEQRSRQYDWSKAGSVRNKPSTYAFGYGE